MIHPNTVAVEYIWDKLVASIFTNEATNTMAEVSSLVNAIPTSN